MTAPLTDYTLRRVYDNARSLPPNFTVREICRITQANETSIRKALKVLIEKG